MLRLKKSAKVTMLSMVLIPSLLLPVITTHADSLSDTLDRMFANRDISEVLNGTENAAAVTTVDEPEPYTANSIAYLTDELEESQGINSDVKAMLCFDSGLVHVAVCQSSNPTKYLYKDWKTGNHVKYGSITLDPGNDLNTAQMNTVIYGHLIYDWKIKQYGFQDGDRRLVFSPLKYLMYKDNYAGNQFLTLVTNNEARYYQVARVYNCPIWHNREGIVTADYMEYNLSYYDENYFNKYMQKVNANSFYNTGVDLEYGDCLLTLQTCIQNRPNNREIVICKELMRMPIDQAKKSFWKEKQKYWN